MDEKEQQQLIEQLAQIVEELGWIIGIPKEEGDDNKVHGLIIGTEEFVYGIVDATGQDVESIEFDTDPLTGTKKSVH